MRSLRSVHLVPVLVGLMGLIGLVAAAPVGAQVSDPERRAEQAAIESGDDLSSRAQRVLFRARTRQDEGDWAGAAAVLEEWLAGDQERDHHLLRFDLAVCQLALDRPAAAAANLGRAVELAPRFARAWLRLGEAAYENGDYAQAGEAFARPQDQAPQRRPEILYYAGASLLAADRSTAALDALVDLVESHPDRAELTWYRALVAAAVAADRPARARPHLERLLHAIPDDPAAWDLAYRFHAGQGDYEQAAVHLTVVGHLRSLAPAEQEQLGDIYANIGVPLQAARYYERAFQTGAEPDPDDYRKLATAWLAAHELAAARTTLERALASRPTRGLWALKGDLEYRAERYAAADTAFAAALALDPEFGRGHLMRGYCAYELDDYAAARSHLERAREYPAQASAASGLLRRLESD